MHSGPSRGRVGGKLPRAPRRLGGPPVKYRKLEAHFLTITDAIARIEMY